MEKSRLPALFLCCRILCGTMDCIGSMGNIQTIYRDTGKDEKIMAQLWGGRFTKETDQLVYRFNASISFDRKFYRQDMEGSMAHVRMLAKQGILTEQ